MSLQARLPLDATITSDEFTHFPTPQLVGLIRASTEKLEQRIQQEEREAEFWKQEGLLAQTRRMQEEHLKIQAEQKVEKVKDKLTEAWTTFRKTTPQLSEIQCNR
jgi:deoxyadenosine/deoxycytidine kinase